MPRWAGRLREVLVHRCGKCGTTQNLWWVRDLQLCLCHNCNGEYKRAIRAVHRERAEQRRYVMALAADVREELGEIPAA